MTEEPRPIVVVGVDGSPSANRALVWASRYAQRVGGSLRLVAGPRRDVHPREQGRRHQFRADAGIRGHDFVKALLVEDNEGILNVRHHRHRWLCITRVLCTSDIPIMLLRV